MRFALVLAAATILVTFAVVQAQETASPTTATASAPATTQATQPTTTSKPHNPEDDKLIEISTKDLPPIVAMRTSKLLKNIDKLKVSVAYFTSTKEPPAQETAKLVVTVDEADKAEPEKKLFVSQITRRTGSKLILEMIGNGFLEKAENLQRQHPPAPEDGYLLVVEGMGTADLYEVLPFTADSLTKLENIRKLLDAESAATLDKAIKKIVEKKAELK